MDPRIRIHPQIVIDPQHCFMPPPTYSDQSFKVNAIQIQKCMTQNWKKII